MKKTTSLFARLKLRDQRNIVIYYRNRRWKTGISVKSKNEFRNGKLTSDYSGVEDYKELNKYLLDKLNFFNKLISEALRENHDTLDYIDTHLKKEERKLKNLKVTQNTPICKAFEDYLAVKKNKFKDFKKERSFQRYLSELSRIKDFQLHNPATISELDMNWIYEFTRFLSKPYKKTYKVVDEINEREYTTTKEFKQTNSTIKRFLQDIITFLKFLSKGQPELSFSIKEMSEFMNSLKSPKNDPNTIVVLTNKQFEALKNYTTRKLKWEIRTLDLFRFCIATGLRYSDAIILNDMYVNERNEIEMNAQKTRGHFIVPMNEDAITIFNKYGRDFTNKFSCDQRINVNLRKILKRIPEFQTKTKAYKFELSELKVCPVIAYEKITFHSSRRTFVTRAIQRGAKMDKIKKWTGWTDPRTLNNYMSIFGEDTSDDLAYLS